jgi:hypothetical protein
LKGSVDNFNEAKAQQVLSAFAVDTERVTRRDPSPTVEDPFGVGMLRKSIRA